MRAPERLTTERLVLRRPVAADAEAIFRRYASDLETTRFLSFPCHRDIAQTQAFLAFDAAEWARWPAGAYLILSRDDGTLLGGTGLSFETAYRASTGYVLAPDAWGRGIATEALGAIVRLAPILGIVRLYAMCYPTHRASINVLQKCGFVFEGILRRHAEFPNLAPNVALDSLSFSRVFDQHDSATGAGAVANYPTDPMTDIHVTPIGVVRSPFTNTGAIPKGLGAQHEAEGVLEIDPALEAGLGDIEGFSHLYVIWIFDRAEGAELIAWPPSDDRPHGVFATRSPQRPNPIGLTVVRLLGRDGTRLRVKGIDMLDGTPIVDIKPYLSNVPESELRRGWLAEAEKRKATRG